MRRRILTGMLAGMMMLTMAGCSGGADGVVDGSKTTDDAVLLGTQRLPYRLRTVDVTVVAYIRSIRIEQWRHSVDKNYIYGRCPQYG